VAARGSPTKAKRSTGAPASAGRADFFRRVLPQGGLELTHVAHGRERLGRCHQHFAQHTSSIANSATSTTMAAAATIVCLILRPHIGDGGGDHGHTC
jgi:hypothetical protein